MSPKKFAKQFWENRDPSRDENAKWLLDRLRDNCEHAERICARCYVAIAILAFVYYCLVVGALSELSFPSVKFKDLGLLKWLLPVLASFLYYRGLCAFLQSRYTQDIIDAYVKKHLSEIEANHLENAVYAITPFNLERLLAARQLKGKHMAFVFAVAVALCGICLPVLLVIVCSVLNLQHLSFHPFPWIEGTLTAIAWVLVARSLLLLWSGWQEFS